MRVVCPNDWFTYRTRYPNAIGPPDMIPIDVDGAMRYVKLTPATKWIRRAQEEGAGPVRCVTLTGLGAGSRIGTDIGKDIEYVFSAPRFTSTEKPFLLALVAGGLAGVLLGYLGWST